MVVIDDIAIPDFVDFREYDGIAEFQKSSKVYQFLSSLNKEDWQVYQDLMSEWGINVYYDDKFDMYVVIGTTYNEFAEVVT